MDYREWLGETARELLRVPLNTEQLDLLYRYYRLLVEGNKKMNLTAITDEKAVFVKHFFDSLTPAPHLSFSEVDSLIDVGTGAGFPGIPLKIAYPHLRLVLLDSLNKRVTFLRETVAQLGLHGVECVHGRAEEVARRPLFRESFDVVTARAVAKLNVLAEYCLPFVRVGGWFVALKGADIEEEVGQARPGVRTLGGKAPDSISLSLPEGMGKRHLIFVTKERPTPKSYPRKVGTPVRNPLHSS
ncbi:ribosomal RNA small subunit methyltransferase G [Kroppenstedtia guangzhouensis]|uniref:Ribosomal RNA small subunit methyltransferase G n=1 Tax=Kroppenstedtia guangzhouensis TaxID=1274356 RepID=A0ABQ1GM93_9BACL|nr:16S rRNA (guanine(527)-N(7))-methyltransferase RsmG [Kroppenstedtia guangzhouensis]GGA46622.1 ribosomal RNA small subunit methyltransferase G [Kroppenstedtia guangzhouensis]